MIILKHQKEYFAFSFFNKGYIDGKFFGLT